MKKILSFITALFFLTACSHQRNKLHIDLDETKPVQVIRLSEHIAVPAQNDKVVDEKDLNEKLSKIDPDFSEKVDSIKTKEAWGITAFVTQITMLGACPFAIGWCLGSIITGYSVTRPLLENAGEKKLELLENYNDRFMTQQ